ncbi:MAG: cyclase family protein [Fuerstiella sp.]|nr:cyclase family protein [Fuerstiella sp.]
MVKNTNCLPSSTRWMLGLTVFVCWNAADVVAQERHTMTVVDVERQITDLSNWGRWGKNDQKGALNLITPGKRIEAARQVKDGICVSLARVAEEKQEVDNPNPFIQQMLAVGRDVGSPWALDNYSVSYHGYAHTHMDALCHLFYRDHLYNGYTQDTVTEDGASRLSIHSQQEGVFTRGVLIDVPRMQGIDYLDPGTAIFPEDLDAWEEKTGIRVASGDVVFIRTGRWARRDALGPWDINKEGLAGLHASCAAWLKTRDVAMLGSDSASDVIPSQINGITHPVHLLMLHAMGVHIFDNCDLEELGRVTERLNRWEFLLTASPIPVKGGTGSPLNPIATF